MISIKKILKTTVVGIFPIEDGKFTTMKNKIGVANYVIFFCFRRANGQI